ncbi:DEHA2E05456p [Debaryomyces hansenii CBS767]|uniref:DEHA2E05456p n=1 Tax=Debaryomyces hansenii (strain ATCC 36239 / CBS 767 / BCRC 21394 / JCM 1990 / NBRC 0083 / IGC 2968) TaxID=284592 RepID=Q6BQG4_DEBHA|nr:DEHA2E05456p [Debaryomyces hansenii CBS767]CAG87783.1 DEHA2E05456p [Debaryomyces hansenii CBS767]|eukprot:XP_459556.1 DEHA2E05456p [Debaryomyces hansenii CBS767]
MSICGCNISIYIPCLQLTTIYATMNEPTHEPNYGASQETNWNASNDSIESDNSNESIGENDDHRSEEHFATTGYEVSSFRRVKRYAKYLLGLRKSQRQPLLPHHSPPSSPLPPRRPINYIIFDIIWNRILSEANRELLISYKWVFFLLSILIVVAVLVITNNFEYLKVFLKSLFCYILNCLRKGTKDCYE